MEFRRVFEEVFRFEVAVAVAVFAVVSLVLLGSLAFSRRRAPDRRKRHSHPVVEGTYAVLLAGVAAVIVLVTFSADDEVQEAVNAETPTAAPQHRVTVESFQWCWRFGYPGGERSVTGECREDGTGLPTLVVPVGKPVQLTLTSSDVIHSFWIPELAVKIDAFPGHDNTVTLTFDEEGRWLGKCAEFCGPYHPAMHFHVRAVSPEKYQQWLEGAAV
ncbi:cytochrome c oxidase subunit II [Saccharomonospora xinjiangensis]|uniref:Cytochrome aa3 subunit 2 n=1 Tax=Saccharomonospora xinjiangensis XJ-54 TaxID=882086 RepID=I0V7E1_9PSEU|nr:cytochrome c oxidase subunit II [Saccharomonospora xinjiangensis]EID56044.1 cytochrome c oxidase, subunit II [Saccharomonospora xinjiangensis XJ-54]